MAAKKQWYTEDGFRYLAEFYFYRILNYENFKMEVEQTNFVIRLIITVQITRLLKFGQISFKR